MRGCFDIHDKKLPNPKGKYFQRYGNKPFIPYKKDVSYLDGKNDDLEEEIDMWNKAIIDDILWYENMLLLMVRKSLYQFGM